MQTDNRSKQNTMVLPLDGWTVIMEKMSELFKLASL